MILSYLRYVLFCLLVASPSEPKQEKKENICETEAEKVLPWKRTSPMDPVTSLTCLTMPDDEHPEMSWRPAWVSNPSYHHLTESGSPYPSPYTSPQNTLHAAPPEHTHTSLFDVFHNGAVTPNHTSDLPPPPNHTSDLPPPPWEQSQGSAEPVTSPGVTGVGDKSSNMLQSSHSLTPPAHHVILPPAEAEEPRPVRSALAGPAVALQSPRHWAPFTMEAHRKKRLESDVMLEEMAYQEGVQSRVSEWLHGTDVIGDTLADTLTAVTDDDITESDESDCDTHL